MAQDKITKAFGQYLEKTGQARRVGTRIDQNNKEVIILRIYCNNRHVYYIG